VESDHAVVVCWDCDGIVVEKSSLELHYAGSPAHATCGFCGVGKRNSADMDEVCVISRSMIIMFLKTLLSMSGTSTPQVRS